MKATNSEDELIDLVDENDQVIGQVSRKIAKSNSNLIHREISVLIFDEKDRVLVQQRSKNKKNDPLVWTVSVAGHVPSAMSYEEAAHKELKEELGFDTNLVLYKKKTYKENAELQIISSYLGKYNGKTKITIDRNEVEKFVFLNQEGLEKLNSRDTIDLESYNDFTAFLKGELDEFKTKLENEI